MNILLGHDRNTGAPFRIPKRSFDTHWHLIGGTGKGKTTAIHTLLQSLLKDPTACDCWFLLDRMGNFSHELLLWATSDFCTQDVRDRIVYIEPAREDVVLGFNPLLYDTPGHCFYKVQRATEVILRAWESVDIEKMPRLARWTFNAFYAAAQLGLTIADCVHLLMPGSPFHAPLLDRLPPLLKAEWAEIQTARGEAGRILESSRNRLKPYFESDVLRRMFGATHNRLDVLRFMREGRIVILNLAAKNRLAPQIADAIGGLVLNEVLATARSLPPGERYPTYLLLDEFQRFVGPDIQEALPEVRQLGLRLILAHQSFSQLVRGDYDLTSMIFQAQSRMIFGVQGEDADLLAHELASITFDPKRIKDELYSRRQRQVGHRIAHLTSWGETESEAENWSKQYGKNWGNSDSRSRRDGNPVETRNRGSTGGGSEQSGLGGGNTRGRSRNTHEQLVPVLEEFEELVMRSYYSFEEDKNIWARDIRNRRTGEAFIRLVDAPTLHDIRVKRSVPGHLSWDAETLRRDFPEALDEVERLIEDNFRDAELFVSPAVIEAETTQRLESVLRPVIRLSSSSEEPDAAPASRDQVPSPATEVPFP